MRKLLLLLLAWCLAAGCAVVRLPVGQAQPVREVTLLGQGQAKVLMVEVSGLLSFRRPWAPPGFPRGESLPVRLRRQLEMARADRDVRALLVRIDSPGGTVTSSDVLFHEIRSFRDELGIPVVAAIVEKGLSGGYYVALAADEIVAHPTSLIGSVGVFVTKLDASGLLREWGIRSETTKSGPQKDILSPLRPLTGDEQETLQALVAELAQRFEETVRVARVEVTESDLERMRSAAPFTASRALELHMIDRVGYLKDAFQAAMSLAGLEAARLVAYRGGGYEASSPGPYSWTQLAAALAAQGRTPLLLDPGWMQQWGEGGLRY